MSLLLTPIMGWRVRFWVQDPMSAYLINAHTHTHTHIYIYIHTHVYMRPKKLNYVTPLKILPDFSNFLFHVPQRLQDFFVELLFFIPPINNCIRRMISILIKLYY